MKTTISFILVCLFSVWSYAAPRSPQQALKIAQSFAASHTLMRHIDARQLEIANDTESLTRGIENYPAYYIINAADNNGFIIISGDDCAREILAYSNKGNLDPGKLPTSAKYWLDFYVSEIRYATEYLSLEDEITNQEPETRAVDPIIEPLLGKIQWDQGSPYNIFCPEEKGEKTVTGCSATAQAMVMKYYGYPKQGVGSYSYTTSTLSRTLSADFGSTTYKWDLMLPQYNKTATQEQEEAVAELMLHCGIAMDMNYNIGSAGGSGAGIFMQYGALTKYFSYNPNMYFEGRDYNTEGRWKNMILDELTAGRPILYSGQGDGGGHAFVLDGCDGNDMYHFNWGWSGYADGYYSLSTLNPGSGGAGSGSGSYNRMQYILMLMQPETTGEVKSYFTIDGSVTAEKKEYNRDETVAVLFKAIFNKGTTMDGNIGLAIYKGDDFVTFLTNPTEYSIPIGSGWNSITLKGTVPASVSNGKYQLHFASQKKGEKVPSVARGAKGIKTYYDIEITNSRIVLTESGSGFELSQLAPANLVGEAVVEKEMTFSLQIENKGSRYEDEFAVYIRKNGGLLPTARISTYATIPSNSTQTITITGDPELPVGEYYAIGSYKKDGDWKQFTGSDLRLVFTIKDVGTNIESTTPTEALKVYATDTGLRITSEDANDMIEIYSANGIKVADGKGNEIEIPLSSKGLYVVRQKNNVVKVIY